MTPFGYSGVLHMMVTSMVYILVLALYSLSLVENSALRPTTTLGAAEGRRKNQYSGPEEHARALSYLLGESIVSS